MGGLAASLTLASLDAASGLGAEAAAVSAGGLWAEVAAGAASGLESAGGSWLLTVMTSLLEAAGSDGPSPLGSLDAAGLLRNLLAAGFSSFSAVDGGPPDASLRFPAFTSSQRGG